MEVRPKKALGQHFLRDSSVASRIVKSLSLEQAPGGKDRIPVVEVGPGTDVFAGSINGNAALEVKVTRLAADNTISRIIHMVEQAQAQKAPAQRWVDRFARVYTPAVVGLAVMVAVVPPLLFGQPFLDAGDGARGCRGGTCIQHHHQVPRG